MGNFSGPWAHSMPPCMLEICNSLARTTWPPMKQPRQSNQPAPPLRASVDWLVVSDAAANWKNFFCQLIELQPCQEFTKRSKIAPLLISQSLITISCEVGGQTQQRYINYLKPLNVFKNLYFLRGKKAKSWKRFFTRIFIVKEKRFFFCRMEDFIDGFVQYLLILYYY